LVEENKALKALQIEFVDKLNSIRNNVLANECLQNSNLTNEQKDNVAEFGYPYSPKEALYHATIGSFPKDIHDKALEIAFENNSQEIWTVNDVGIYVMDRTKNDTFHKSYKELFLI
jgi:hypothetical protein